jgi:hypothetical protein
MSVGASDARSFDLGDRCETLGCPNTVTDTETDGSYINIDTGVRCSDCVDATPLPSNEGSE